MSRCPNCMSELQQDKCTRCGYPSIEVAAIRGALPRETVLVEQYELGYALAANQQGIAYIAFDRAENQPVIVQEFFPKQAAVRKGAAVSPKDHQAMYADACRRFLTSTQQMPLQLVNAFAANNTAYRVYQLNGSPVSAVDEAEMLLDHFIWFRGQDGKPVMAVNALPIPPLPQQTPWQLSSRLVSEQKRKNINRVAAMLLAVIAAAVAGVVYLNVTRLYDVSVRVQTEAPITGAQLGDLMLPPAVPKDGYVEYTAQLRSGDYAFTAENEKDMDVSSVVQVNGAATAARFAIPTTTPEPMHIGTGEWLFVSNGQKTLYQDGTSLNVTEERLADGTELCNFTLFAAEGDKLAGDVPLLYLVREEDQSRAALVWQNNRVEFQVSPGAYSLVCEMDGGKQRVLQDVDLTAGQFTLPVPMRAYGCLFDLEKSEGEPRAWFAGQYDCGLVRATPEELADWAASAPELFGDFRMYKVSFRLDEQLKDLGAQLFINGNETAWRPDKDIAWFNGVERMVDAEVRLNGVTYLKKTVNVRAKENTAYILGESLVQDAEKAWQDVRGLMRIGDIVYISRDGENFELLQTDTWNDMQDSLKLLTHEEQGRFALHEVKINMPEPVRVPADAVTGVELGGQSIAWNKAGQQEPLSISNGTYDLMFVMKDGGKLPEQIRVDGAVVTIEMESVKADALEAYERVNKCTGIAGLMEDAQGNVSFIMEVGYSVPEVSAADVLCDERRYGSASWHKLDFDTMHDVSINLDERIDPEKAKVSDAKLNDTLVQVEGRSFGVSKVTPGEYTLTFSVNGEKRRAELRVADNNNLNLLSKEADEQLATLVFGKDDENAEPVLLAGDTSLLTDAAVAAAEPGELHPLTLSLPEAEERIDCSIAIKPDAEGAKALDVQPESPMVYLTAGNYTLEIKGRGEDGARNHVERLEIPQTTELDLTETLTKVQPPVYVPQEIRMAIDERVNVEEAILAVKLENQNCWDKHAENPWECVRELAPGAYGMLVQLNKGEQHEYTLTVTGAMAEDGETQKLTHVLTNAEGAEVKALLEDVTDEACAAMRWWGTPEKGYVQLAGMDWNWLLTEDALEATKDEAHEVTVVFPLQRWRNDDMTFELHLTEQPTQVLHFRKNVHMTEDDKEVRKKIQILYLPDGNYEMWTTYGNGAKKETRKLGTITVTAANEQPLVLGPGHNMAQMLVRGETEWQIKLIQEFYDKAGIEKEQHICNFTIFVSKDLPSCTQKGNEVYRCSDPNCNKESKTEIDAPGHSYTDVVTAPTCTEEGYTEYTCGACGDTYKGSYTDATGHSDKETIVPPTCTAGGYTEHTCSVCDRKCTDNEKDPTGHDMEADKNTWEEATCTDAAKATWRCKNCDYSEEKTEGDPRGHNLVGLTINGQRYCKQCNKWIEVPPEENP